MNSLPVWVGWVSRRRIETSVLAGSSWVEHWQWTWTGSVWREYSLLLGGDGTGRGVSGSGRARCWVLRDQASASSCVWWGRWRWASADRPDPRERGLRGGWVVFLRRASAELTVGGGWAGADRMLRTTQWTRASSALAEYMRSFGWSSSDGLPLWVVET